MELRVRQGSQEPILTATAGVRFATQLVSGTVVLVAGSGLDLTVPLPPRFCITALRKPKALKLEKGSRPSVSVQRSRKRRKRPTVATVNTQDVLTAMQKHVGHAVAERHVVFQKIVVAEPQHKAPVRLLGRKGSASCPTKKSYDLDLDEYQSD